VAHGGYARWFNDRHRRVGHLFQGRFGSVRIQDDAHLWMTARYVVRNPVEAGFCERPEDWAWAAHASICRGDVPRWLDTGRLTALLSALGGDPRERYHELAAA
jgi:putative transposase